MYMHAYSDSNSEIVVDTSSTSPIYPDFTNALPEDQPRFAVYKFEIEQSDQITEAKLVFTVW